jgi:hypothetical protein
MNENGVKPVRLVDNVSTGDAEIVPTNANATRGTAATEETNLCSALVDAPWMGPQMPYLNKKQHMRVEEIENELKRKSDQDVGQMFCKRSSMV